MNDYERSEIKRPSTWLISIGIGFAAVSARILADLERGVMTPAPFYFWLWVQVTSAMLALISGGYGLIVFILWLPRLQAALKALRPPPPAAPTPPPAQPRVIYQREIPGTVMGKPTSMLIDSERSERWAKWNETALEVMAWYRVTGSLIYSVMAGKGGKAFKENKDAQAVYTEMDRLGLVVLSNGRATVLADSVPSVLAAIRGGRLDWREDIDPPQITPAPLKPAAGQAQGAQRLTVDQSG